MRERPILMSGPMVRAILAGRKTQTRRVVRFNPPYTDHASWKTVYHHDGFGWLFMDEPIDGKWAEKVIVDRGGKRCPYGVPGDRLWVRETWRDDGESGPIYRADYADPAEGIWRPSIFMPRRFSRLLLELTDVRVQRVQDITEEDAKAEGIKMLSDPAGAGRDYILGDGAWNEFPRASFCSLWDSINAKRGYGWSVNPYVWALTFRRIDDGKTSVDVNK